MTTRPLPVSSALPSLSPGVTGEVVHAGFWRQMGALLLDSLLIMTVSPVVAWLVFLAAMIVPVSRSIPANPVAGVDLALLAVVVTAWLLTVAYHALFDASAMQATPGKRVLGIKVVDVGGARIGLMRALVRAMLQSPPCTIGYLLILFGRRKRGVHDVIAGTLVVDRWAWTATPDRQSSTINRTAAWIGTPMALALGLLLVIPKVQGWMDAGTDRDLQDIVGDVRNGSGPHAEPPRAIAVPAVATNPESHGMTWGVGPAPTQAGVTQVSCHGQPFAPTANGSCDAYIGDTACSTVLPVLCLLQDHRPAPDASLRESWGEGRIALAPAIAGSTFRSQGDANNYCSARLGPGWRLAEHHDGQQHGWVFHATGTIPEGSRFWVANNDMHANCWNSKPRPRKDAQFSPGSDDAPQLESRDVRFSGIVQSFDAGCWSDGACSIVVDNRTIFLPSSHPGVASVVSGHVDNPPAGEEWVGQRVEVHCSLLRGGCSLEGRTDYYIRLLGSPPVYAR